ncbi:MAG: protein kinase [Deltaproteobacteria bacterium]|uniref:Protein kinase n=1 Tax=Candidatus Zymogenus saltonus TaxID=2844893 RepID=A0A9D8KDF5_9DELT|nr:protein kinase [Candidatus Zymogenus saltonus]
MAFFDKKTIECPTCGRENENDNKFCVYDGTPLTITCPHCKKTNPFINQKCVSCGNSLSEKVGESGRYTNMESLGDFKNYQSFRAYDTSYNKKVVLKKLNVIDDEEIKRFESEFTSLSIMNIKGIPTVFDLKQNDGALMTVRDYVEGKNLYQYIEKYGKLEGDTLKLFIDELLTILENLEKGRVVHGNIKPKNIIVNDEVFSKKNVDVKRPFVSLTDFASLSLSSHRYPEDLLPPELKYDNLEVTRDHYAFGMLLTYVMTGKLMSRNILMRVDNFDRISGLGDLVQVIKKLVNPEPEKRFLRTAEIRKIIESAYEREEKGIGVSMEERTPKIEPIYPEEPKQEYSVEPEEMEKWKPPYKGAFLKSGNIKKISSVALSPNGRYIGVGDDDGSVHIWHVSSGAYIDGIEGQGSRILTMAFSHDGNVVAYGDDNAKIRLWNMRDTHKTIKEMNGHKGEINDIAFSYNGRLLISGSDDKTIKVWDVETCDPIYDYDEHKNIVISLDTSPRDNLFASSSYDHTIKIWRDDKRKSLATIYSDLGTIMSLSFTPNGKYIIGGSKHGPIGMWKVSNGQSQRIFNDHNDIVSSMWVNEERNILVSAGFDNRIVVRSLESDVVLDVIERPVGNGFGGIIYVTISPDCKYIIFCDEKRGVFSWDLSKNCCHKILGPQYE